MHRRMISFGRTAALVIGLWIVWGTTQLAARHIIGGNITYKCLGDGNYEFTMVVYRDCNCTECAELDQTAFIGIYRCPNGSCSGLNQNSTFARLSVPLKSRAFVEKPDYPCLIEPDICVEQGVYVFELADYNVRLPVGSDTYHISYQRCCRNISINNIFRPDDEGATYTIEITPEAQEVCNNSPEFNDFPPTVICADAPLVFDHSASDPDGDQLVYEFCAPLTGGGPALGTVIKTCAGAYPDPACPPPYGVVSFIPPNYSGQTPMAGDPIISIDPNTGRITGTPNIQGQFVVGVCVSEYRNGVLLSRVFRDFQFNVESCDPTVIAELQEDIRISDKEFQVNSCGSTDVLFVNESYQERFIDVYQWSFDINNETRTFNDWSPTVTFPGVGEYEGTLILNPGTDCGDTAYIKVNIFPDLEADFSYEYDTCIAGEVNFTDLSTSATGFITDYQWNFGDGQASNQQNPDHLYRSPGDIPVTLSIRDTNQCETSSTQVIRYYPVPNLIVIAPSSFNGCTPGSIFFDNLSFPIDTTYDILWNFGDGGQSNAISPTYVYEDEGVFTVDLTIISPIGCITDTIFPDLITILPSPEAGFTFLPEEPNSLEPVVTFSDQSSGASRWFWDFDDGTTAFVPSPVHDFRDTGRYEVLQVVTHPNGCTDTAFQLIDIKPEVRYFLPNAFTPNNDGKNDIYKGVGIMQGATNFSMTIWNRWGQQLFQSTDPDTGWNGRIQNSGAEVQNGVYTVLVRFTGPRGEDFEYKTFATLVR